MDKKVNNNLIIDGNAFYEIDSECMKKGLNCVQEKEREKEKNKKVRKS